LFPDNSVILYDNLHILTYTYLLLLDSAQERDCPDLANLIEG
jgi:hypothetical protein